MVENKIHIPLVWTHVYDKHKDVQHVCGESRNYINAVFYIKQSSHIDRVYHIYKQNQTQVHIMQEASIFLFLILINYIGFKLLFQTKNLQL